MAQTLLRTPLFERHVAAGARLVPFAGWELPVQYQGVTAEHRAVRTDAGVFDVSHMGELEVEGPRARDLLQQVLSNDLDRVEIGHAQYTLLTNEDGGIVDDVIVYRLDVCRYLLVVNAANHETDLAWLEAREISGSDVRDVSDEYALLAVQGPRAVRVLGLPPAPRFTFSETTVDGVPVMASRTGYTGEDGCELLCMAEDAAALWDATIARGVTPCGLGARDTLRLEARLSLYGNDIDETTNPIEAGLGWVVKLGKGDFVGREALEKIKASPLPRKMVGFEMIGKGIARHGYPLRDESSEIGICTSGSPCPTVGKNLGLGYLQTAKTEIGTTFFVDCRGKNIEARVVPTPFYKRK
jgi:aminomethyltransferase